MRLKKFLLCCLGLIFTCSCLTSLYAQEISLFNGKDLDGWYKFVKNRGVNNDPKNVFTVHDGVIHISGEEFGCITTNKSFDNYELTLEFKWGEKTWGGRKDKARDSGVLVHSYGEDGGFGGVWMRSIEANILEGGIGDFWLVTGLNDGVEATCKVDVQKNGRTFAPQSKTAKPVTIKANAHGCFSWIHHDPNSEDVLNYRGAHDIDKPNDWNKIKVVMNADVMIVYVNDQLVNEIYDLKLPQYKGKIQLQSEGAEIFYRNIKIKPIK